MIFNNNPQRVSHELRGKLDSLLLLLLTHIFHGQIHELGKGIFIFQVS